jgi:integrase
MGGKMGSTSTVSPGIELAKGTKSESIRIKFMYRGMECRETLTLAHTKSNTNYAIRLRGEILNAIEKGTFKYIEYFPNSKNATKFGAAPSRVLVGDLLREQLRIAERTLSPMTAKTYRIACEVYLFKQWDKTPIRDLTPPLLRAWLGTFTFKIKTARNMLQPLSNALVQAVNDDLIETNPLDRVKLTKIMSKEQRKSNFEPDPLDMKEIDAILKIADGQKKNLIQFAFATGMRPSELMALRWESVDWLNMKVRVERVKVAGVIKEEAKTAAGNRDIDMRQAAYDALKAQQQFTALAGGVVFHDPGTDAEWGTDKAMRQRWVIILRKAKVRYRNPYQTRHTFASTLLSAGENALYVAKQMGHKNTEMLNRHYGRWIEQGSDENTRAQSAAFFAKISPKFQDSGSIVNGQ